MSFQGLRFAVNCIGPKPLSLTSLISQTAKMKSITEIFEWVGFLRLIHLDRRINWSYNHFGNSKPLVSLKIKAIASLISKTWAITPKNLFKRNLSYSSFFKAYFMKIFAAGSISCFYCRKQMQKQPFGNVLKKENTCTGVSF